MLKTPIQNPGRLSTTILFFSIVTIWFGLILQFCISMPDLLHKGWSLPGALVQFFSFFTIQCNILAGLSLIALLLKPQSWLHNFFSRGYVFTGIILYIIIVGLVYNIILRGIWQPTGLLKLADELLHVVNPLLFIVYWLIFVRKQKLKWSQALNWLWYPFLYLLYVLIRGALTNLYPYPFIDAGKLGYNVIIINSLGLLAVFLLLGLLLVFITRKLSSKTS
ncbi:MAG: Pr6Pr family membrane protein [Mucilaginibacter sp.]|uniref:Pr6Pr family membrane protein n=1 Tax=Mucilaginibacter sp. TaxID=1882438 RepID=UPI0031A02178